jgi:hypothetical protein
MASLLNVVIVLARCAHSREPFGIRMEEKSRGQWTADWAFSMEEGTAKREGYDRTAISGVFSTADTYPGCPTCRSRRFFKCGCGKVCCWDGERRTVTCSWCGTTGILSGSIDRLNAGGDR